MKCEVLNCCKDAYGKIQLRKRIASVCLYHWQVFVEDGIDIEKRIK